MLLLLHMHSLVCVVAQQVKPPTISSGNTMVTVKEGKFEGDEWDVSGGRNVAWVHATTSTMMVLVPHC